MDPKGDIRAVPPWVLERLEGGSPQDGSAELNQHLTGNGQVTTHPTRTVTTSYQKGSQRRHQ